MAKISVVIADDHVLVRQGIRRFLEAAGDIEVLAEVGDGLELLRKLAQVSPDVVLLDLHMPQMTGIEAAQRIKRDYPRVRILVLTADDAVPQVLALLKTGADGYVLKTARMEEVIHAVRQVYSGNVALSPQVATQVVHQVARMPSAPEDEEPLFIEPLTERELRVLRLAAQGKTNREIGQALAISHRTVQGHLADIYDKLHVHSRTEAVTEALKLGWMTIERGAEP
ncbi:MAG TPA: response regulator transcription factor [Anaerolineae bacterium]|nr:response regulator transcription factor [Anaerolineae bacterium]HRT32005.1 response regulator transcription factor [Anaerolineae bacterium]HXK43424.1 response regulator transcription factor [Anaerolineae bacterium]